MTLITEQSLRPDMVLLPSPEIPDGNLLHSFSEVFRGLSFNSIDETTHTTLTDADKRLHAYWKSLREGVQNQNGELKAYLEWARGSQMRVPSATHRLIQAPTELCQEILHQAAILPADQGLDDVYPKIPIIDTSQPDATYIAIRGNEGSQFVIYPRGDSRLVVAHFSLPTLAQAIGTPPS